MYLAELSFGWSSLGLCSAILKLVLACAQQYYWTSGLVQACVQQYCRTASTDTIEHKPEQDQVLMNIRQFCTISC